MMEVILPLLVILRGFWAKSPFIKIRTSSISNKSFELEYIIMSKDDKGSDIVHATGKSVQVMIDLPVKKSIKIPSG